MVYLRFLRTDCMTRCSRAAYWRQFSLLALLRRTAVNSTSRLNINEQTFSVAMPKDGLTNNIFAIDNQRQRTVTSSTPAMRTTRTTMMRTGRESEGKTKAGINHHKYLSETLALNVVLHACSILMRQGAVVVCPLVFSSSPLHFSLTAAHGERRRKISLQ